MAKKKVYYKNINSKKTYEHDRIQFWRTIGAVANYLVGGFMGILGIAFLMLPLFNTVDSTGVETIEGWTNVWFILIGGIITTWATFIVYYSIKVRYIDCDKRDVIICGSISIATLICVIGGIIVLSSVPNKKDLELYEKENS